MGFLNPEQLAKFREMLTQNRQPEHRANRYANPNGWNDAIDFVEKVLKEVLGEK